MKIKIVNQSQNPLPEYKTLGASGMDLLSNNEEVITIAPMERQLVPTGIFVEIPLGYEGQVRARSGLSIKNGITLVNCVGTIDSDYRGELKIPIINLGNEPFTINKGDRVAQLIIAKYERIDWETVENVEDTHRGTGGFGSTGV
ncbi:dUTP diphosphatase [Fusibacter bizertensis]|jgi:deoxyuridine 5''-triphosphate nucleotidohydrolase (dut)|uniref:Deoxyuridine 5'-triphosphate nucleotidohydrolase n=1 Tax=Fusibacter bizertensis TaxID=1488331 RepID=A0ABT6N842_9FIRM|nr:dUTP diphosphatase [Fusibacter bizertensis]MDH8676577.1 dUTP diphosphatase [Fusibacter bizertensis]